MDYKGFEKAGKLRSEFVIAVTGTVENRGGAVNENLATGAIELRAESLRILAESDVPPFPIEENSKTKDEIRLKYRYLDLRRPDLQRNIMLKSKVAQLTRKFFTEEGFLEIETPMLGKSTPEGARDYLVPSRIHPGSFYGLPPVAPSTSTSSTAPMPHAEAKSPSSKARRYSSTDRVAPLEV